MGERESWWTRKGLYKMIFLIHFTLGVIYCAHVPFIIMIHWCYLAMHHVVFSVYLTRHEKDRVFFVTRVKLQNQDL